MDLLFHLSSLLHLLCFNWQYLISLKKMVRERSTLDIQDFQVTDVLGEKSPIMIGPKPKASSEENLHEDMSVPSFSHLIIKLSALDSDTEYVSEQQDDSLQAYYLNYITKGDDPDDAPPLPPCQTHPAPFAYLIQEGNVDGQDMLSQTGEMSLCFSENEAENTANCSFQGKCDGETARGQTACSPLLCEEGYISNSHFTLKPTDEDIKLYHNVSVAQTPTDLTTIR